MKDKNSRFALQQLVVPAVLIAVLFLVFNALYRETTFLVVVGAGVLLVLRWPPLGLMFVILSGLVVPYGLGTGTGTSLNLAALLLPALVGLWIIEMLARRELRLYPSQPILPLLVLCGAVVLSFIAGTEPWLVYAQTASLRAQLGGLAIFLLSAAAFLLAGHQLRNILWLRWLVWLFLFLGALFIIGRLVPQLSHVTSDFFSSGSSGSLFWVWIAALSISQAGFNSKLLVPSRFALFGLTLITLYVAFYQGGGWTSGWLPATVAVIATLWIGAPRLGLVATMVVIALIAVDPPRALGLVLAGDNLYSLTTRVEAWTILAQILETSPLIGLGPANYYAYTPLFPIYGYAINFNSHNNYVDLIAQIGLLGLACFLWFAFEVGRLALKLRKNGVVDFEKAYVCGALGGLVGTLVAGMLGDWVLPFVYNIGFDGFRSSVLGWIFLGGLVAIEQANRRLPAEEHEMG
ncbi:MAG: O-antigen ligase family protein [Chloroflexota bacterium]|jgi:O-antigen ligase